MLALLLVACASFAVIPYDPDWSFAAAGPYDACGWRSDGYLACSTNFGGSDLHVSPITQALDEGFRGAGFAGVAVADYAACTLQLGAGLDTGYPVCFGSAEHALVDGDPASAVTDVLDPLSLVAGERHACGLSPEGAPSCWGDDSVGQSSPPEGPFLTLAAGSDHTCGLDPDGLATCWGGDLDAPPAYVIKGDPGTAEVAAGHGITCTLTGDQDIWCSSDPTDAGDTSPWTDGIDADSALHGIAVGDLGLCALDEEDEIRCVFAYEPTDPPHGRFRTVSMASRRAFGCGVTEDGDLSCFGTNDEPALEDWNN